MQKNAEKYLTRKSWLSILASLKFLQYLLPIMDTHHFTLLSSPSPNDWEKGPASRNGYMTNSPVPNTITCPSREKMHGSNSMNTWLISWTFFIVFLYGMITEWSGPTREDSRTSLSPKIFGCVLKPKGIFHYHLSSRYANNTTTLRLQTTEKELIFTRRWKGANGMLWHAMASYGHGKFRKFFHVPCGAWWWRYLETTEVHGFRAPSEPGTGTNGATEMCPVKKKAQPIMKWFNSHTLVTRCHK